LFIPPCWTLPGLCARQFFIRHGVFKKLIQLLPK
ncbi:MAG: hypothetical protein ACI94O_001840, partial [Octadecabacter sp.]